MMTVRFKKQFIAAETFEAAAVFDVDGDGVPDIVCGGFWYQGPDFRRKHLISPNLTRYNDYYDDFSVIPLDVDGDGRIDFITGGWWGKSLRWRQNSGKPGEPWAEHVLAGDIGNIETTRAWDIDGDGILEILPNTPNAPFNAYKLNGSGTFTRHLIYADGIGHGLGFGDVDSDGLGEFVTTKGILKRPADGALSGPWTLSEEVNFPADMSIPALVVDINGDGVNEIIIGNAHSYGLSWWGRSVENGKPVWSEHVIDDSASQYHDLHWADIDGDGVCELITGKRYRAHCGSDPGEFDEIGIYYFKWTGRGFEKHVISYGPPGEGSGCGIQFAVADLRGTGRLDIVAPGKDGLHVFFNEGV